MAERIDESNIDEAERETIQVANSTLTALESALAAWEASKTKPDSLKEKFDDYARLRDELAGWMTKALRARSEGDSFESRQKRLAEFSSICKRYKGGC
jgi:hypothetical protein